MCKGVYLMWNYANLSKMAKTVGGPERLVEIIYDSGVKAGRYKVLLFLPFAFLAGLGIGGIVEHFRNKRIASDAELEAAKQELIQGIKDYDAEHGPTASK